jgi:hypothetical protein
MKQCCGGKKITSVKKITNPYDEAHVQLQRYAV